MVGFTIVWIGQIISVLATNMTAFALTIWVFQKTESATALGLMQVFFITPFLLISPLAGVWVDRYNRKLMMMVSDLAAGMGTVTLIILQATGSLQIWHLYVAVTIQGLGNAFQWPAYSAAISTMVPKEQYGRANGMMSLIEAGPGVFSPMLAGALLPVIGLTGIFTIDIVAFLFAIGVLFFVHIPQPEKTIEGQLGKGSIWKEAIYGFQYIFKRPSLLGLQVIFLFGNLFSGIAYTLVAPMVLSRTGQNTMMLGSVQTAGAVGGILGGILMSAWGGFKQQVHGVLAGWALSSAGFILFGAGSGLGMWIPALVVGSIFGPVINSSNQAIWQAKVAPDVQGRVFSARRLIAWITNPISPIIAGTLSDFVFEPAMRLPGSTGNLFSPLVGSGPGAGSAVIIILCGLSGLIVGLTGYFITSIRNVEGLLPDHDHLQKIGELSMDAG